MDATERQPSKPARRTPRPPIRDTHPDIYAQADPALNPGIDLDKLTRGSNTIITWRCTVNRDHTWPARVYPRTRSRGCPRCAGKFDQPLRDTHPDVYAQADPLLNPGVNLDTLTKGSKKIITWRCPTNPAHTWPANVNSRTSGRGSGCPRCAGKSDQPFRESHPDIYVEADPALNPGIDLETLTKGSRTIITWRCTVNPAHTWPAKVGYRTIGRGCPHCAGRVNPPLRESHPDIYAQVDPVLNLGVDLDALTKGSDKIIIWRCTVNSAHTWPATVSNRTKGRGCPRCAGMSDQPLRESHPDIYAQADPALNPGIDLDSLTAGSRTIITWRCTVKPAHTWPVKVNNRTSGTGCPDCATGGFKTSLPGFVYLLRRTWAGVEQRKIGITNVPRDRLATLRREGWEEIDISYPLDGEEAREIEQRFLAVLDVLGLRTRSAATFRERYDGYTEVWPYAEFPVDSIAEVFAAVGYLEDPDTMVLADAA